MRLRAACMLLVALAAGCAGRSGPPEIIGGTPCSSCGMGVSDRHFACERRVAGGWRVYDSVECLLRDAGGSPGGGVYLADYDTQALHAADSLWVVRGEFSTPMGGGLAAFLRRGAADTVAAETRGRVGRLAEFATGRGGVAGGVAGGVGRAAPGRSR